MRVFTPSAVASMSVRASSIRPDVQPAPVAGTHSAFPAARKVSTAPRPVTSWSYSNEPGCGVEVADDEGRRIDVVRDGHVARELDRLALANRRGARGDALRWAGLEGPARRGGEIGARRQMRREHVEQADGMVEPGVLCIAERTVEIDRLVRDHRIAGQNERIVRRRRSAGRRGDSRRDRCRSAAPGRSRGRRRRGCCSRPPEARSRPGTCDRESTGRAARCDRTAGS